MRDQARWNLWQLPQLQQLDSSKTKVPTSVVGAKSCEHATGTHGSCEVILGGKTYLAVTDTQASANVVSLAFAIEQRVEVEWIRVPFKLSNGAIRHSIGRATAECGLSSDNEQPRAHQFYIVRDTAEPLVVGRKFLHEAGLAKFPKRRPQLHLKDDDDADIRSIWTTRSLDPVEHCRWQVRGELRYKGMRSEVFVVPDTGSPIDLMSLSYAELAGIEILPLREDSRHVCTGDGGIIEAAGFTHVSLRFDGEAGRYGHNPLKFLVIDGLPFSIGLGYASIERYGILNTSDDFHWAWLHEEYASLCMLRPHKRELSPVH